ncbi:MAG: UvrD-helicase domain-containing protein [Oscillospiraceae bacterium]|nr:UvrD-helicase domain-containing protein [Oscillospiraceae bacterium]
MKNESFINLKRKALEKYFSGLNEMQRKAVFQVKGPLLILAGAGSGKTTVLINRIINLIKFGDAYNDESSGNIYDEKIVESYLKGININEDQLRDAIAVSPVNPKNILAITFTNKAAGELKKRLELKLGQDGLNVNASTFHSACVRILRRNIDRLGFDRNFTIYDSDDSQRMIKSVMAELEIPEKNFPPKSMLSEISSAKNKLESPKQVLDNAGSNYRSKTVARIYASYQMRMKEANALDFDDIILFAVMLFESCPDVLEYYRNIYKYIMVDEYQDTNYAQFKFVSLLSSGHQNICVVGDDDQSIYKFRGADIKNILNFEEQFKNTVTIRLEQNYRSTKNILNVANSLIRNNNQRKSKTLWTDSAEGNRIIWYKSLDENDESEFVVNQIKSSFKKDNRYNNNAILYRMNAQSNNIEKCLVKNNIPYKIFGGMRFFDRKEIKDITAYLNVINNPFDMLRFKRIVNEPKRGIGDATVSLIEEICRDLQISPIEVMRNASEYPPISKKAVQLKNVAGIFDLLNEKVNTIPLVDFIDEVVSKTGYLNMLKSMGDEGAERLENIKELKTNVLEYLKENPDGNLNGFLEEVALYSEADRDKSNTDCVTLMTVHSAKGLEFDNVFIIGMEDGLFPSSRAFDSEDDIEEERRLAYVAITRAKKQLYISSAGTRTLFGQTRPNITSRFIKEIDMNFVEKKENSSRKHRNSNYKDVTAVQSIPLQQQMLRNRAVVSKTEHSDVSFKICDTVVHKIFGEGKVISVSEVDKNNVILEIAFENAGVKRMTPKFVKKK